MFNILNILQDNFEIIKFAFGVAPMIIEHQQSNTDPIIATTLAGDITFADASACFQVVDKYLSDNDLPMVYWIIDAKKMRASYSNLIQIVEATSGCVLGSGGDPRVIPIMVADKHVSQFLHSELENRYVWTDFPTFDTVADAWLFVQYISYLQVE